MPGWGNSLTEIHVCFVYVVMSVSICPGILFTFYTEVREQESARDRSRQVFGGRRVGADMKGQSKEG